jgi:Sortase domain
MTIGPDAPLAKRHTGRWVAVAGALVLLGGACLGLGLQTHHHRLAAPVASSLHRSTVTPAPRTKAVAPTGQGVAPATAAVPVVAYSVPVALSIPAIGVDVSLSELGLNPTGTVQVPTDYEQPGWFDLGPSPGQMGSSVILGHVDTFQGPTIFFHLPTLQPGDQVIVTLADGAVATFDVRGVTSYLKTQFPADLVYATHGTDALQLVTCGGAFDTATGHYLSDVVVFTTLVTSTPATSAGAGSSS